MPRTRSVKPEFWDDEKLATISRDARLTFIGLWTNSDDYGVVKGHPAYLKNKIFPYDDIKPKEFESWLKDLETVKVISPFSHNGEKYYHIRHFLNHQSINHPSKRIYPEPPPIINDRLPDDSGRTLGALPFETETETETETEVEVSPGRVSTSNNGDFLSKIKTNPAYSHVDIDTELSKMDAWLMLAKNRGRKKTPRFILNWLNKIEKPLEGLTGGKAPW